MPALHTLLVATDFSDEAALAAERAAGLAAALDAQLLLVHAFATSALDDLRQWLGGEEPQLVAASLAEQAERRLAADAAALAAAHGVPVHARLRQGDPATQIVAAAQEVDAGLIVIGRRGLSGLHRALLGTTAERIARRAALPVLMVHRPIEGAYRRVLVPVDFSPYSLPALKLSQQLAPSAELVLMHGLHLVSEGQLRLADVSEQKIAHYRAQVRQHARSRLAELAAQAGMGEGASATSTPDGASPWLLIVEEARRRGCELIVIGRHGRHRLDEFLLGGTTRMVLAESESDVLVCSAAAAG